MYKLVWITLHNQSVSLDRSTSNKESIHKVKCYVGQVLPPLRGKGRCKVGTQFQMKTNKNQSQGTPKVMS